MQITSISQNKVESEKRGLLIMVTVLCIWLGIKVNSGNHQKHVVCMPAVAAR